MANADNRAAADSGDRSPHLLPRVPADESQAHSLHLRRTPAEEGEAHDRPNVDDVYSHLLRRTPADESDHRDRADAEAGDPSSPLSLRRAPAKKAEAGDPSFPCSLRRAPAKKAEVHDHKDADRSSHFLPRAPPDERGRHDRADADVDHSPSLRLRRPPAVDAKADEAGCCRRENGIVGDTRQPVKPVAADTDAHRCGWQESGVGGDTYLPSNPAADAGGHCSGQREKAAIRDKQPDPNADHVFGGPSSLSAHKSCPNSQQVTISDTGLGARCIDPNHVYQLYRRGQLNNLLKYMDTFPTVATDYNYLVIKELVYISMRGNIPEHLKFEWNLKRAETARDLACRFFAGGINFVWCTKWLFWPELLGGFLRIDGRLASSQEAVTSTPGHSFQKIPLRSGFSGQVPNVKGINPLCFYSRHPVWGGHALPVQKREDEKVGSFFCTYCDKDLVGNANGAVMHMRKGCKIPLHILRNLLKEVEQYKERTEQLRSAKKDSKAKGRRVRTVNDGAAILQQSDAAKITKLVAELSHSEQYAPLDGITGVLAMTQSLFMQNQNHLGDRAKLIKVAECSEMAARIACDHLDHISETFTFTAIDKEALVNTCMAALSTNSVSSDKVALANVAAEAVLRVANWERREVNLDLIQMKGKLGRKLAAELVHGIFIDNQLSHRQMPKRIEGAKIAFLSFEPSNIDMVEASRMLDKEQLEEMILKCQDIGATLVMCRWNFDEKASHLLMQRKLAAVSGVSDVELKEIANSTGGQVAQKIQHLSPHKLGEAKLVREQQIGKTKGRVLYIESYASPGPVTIFVRAGSNTMLEETMSKVADVLCVLRSLIIEDKFVCGGGSAEISCSIAVEAAADASPGYTRPFIKSFARALDALPLAAVSENSGSRPIDMLTVLKSRHIKEKNAYLGIDCNGRIENMKDQNVFASLAGKKKQIMLALKVLKIMLQVDDVT